MNKKIRIALLATGVALPALYAATTAPATIGFMSELRQALAPSAATVETAVFPHLPSAGRIRVPKPSPWNLAMMIWP